MTIHYCFALLLLASCAESPQKKTLREGKQLAEKHCVSCHQFPEPDLLDKSTWVFQVLPKMGRLLGFDHFETTNYFQNDLGTPRMSIDEWNKLVYYYVRQAPEQPKPREKPPAKIDTALKQFSIEQVPFSIKPPLTSYAGIFPGINHIVFADGITKYIYTISDFKVTDSFLLDIGISQITLLDGKMFGLAMGVMYPSDNRSGKLKVFHDGHAVTLLDSLQRPVHATYADLNDDSLSDIIICEFGNNTGQLSWFEKQRDSSYIKHILKPLPGAVKTVARDFDNDGRLDIMALMAQADEGMFIYYNKGNNNFREQRILRFSPAYGSNYFELKDMNQDGFDDIVATNGDNGDYPAILKAYHGVRIYLNDGKNNYKEQRFLPVNGACKVVCRDFDNDGDIDLASIAYFPDFEKNPYESFIYWENTGQLTFRPFSFAQATNGRWLVMDAGDVDGDGDEDIILGSAKMAMGSVPDAIMKTWNDKSPSILVLKNTKVR